MAIDDFSRSRVDDGIANRPSSRRPWHPFDDVVADVHSIDTFGQQLDLKGILVTSGGKCLVPPPGAFANGGPNRLGNCAVNVINDRLDRLAHGCGGISLCQPESCDITFHNGFVYRSSK